MRVLMVWDGNYPWDVRVEKVWKTIRGAGHEVHLVCRNSNAKPRRENIDGLCVRRIFAFEGALAPLNPAITFPAFFSPLWSREIRTAIDEIKPDVIIIRDLPMALGVLPHAKARGIPTILDMAECYPEMIRCAWQFEKFRISNIFVRNPYLADRVEAKTLKDISMVWAMIEESAERLQRKGVDPDRIRIVSNTPPVENVAMPGADQAGGKILRVVYTGLINPSRGLATVVQAAQIIKREFADFEIKIVGSGKDLPRIRELVKTLGVEDKVELTGWIDHKALGAILAQSDAGLVSHYSCSHWNNTIPNKIFDYMKARIPVIVSDVKPAKRIVEATRCGLVYHDTDAADLAAKILQLRDPALRRELGDNGYRAVAERYNWSNDSRMLLQSLEEVARAGRPALA